MHASRSADPLRAARAAGCGFWMLLFCGASAFGQTVDFNSTTLLRLHPDWRAGDTRTGVGATEWLGLSARGIKVEGIDDLNVQVVGWGRADMLPRAPDGVLSGDVDLAYVQGALFSRHLSLTLGRQLITGGAARVLQLDGLNATANIGKGFGVSGFAGVQTTPRFAYPGGDFSFGGRAFWRHSFETEVGVSFAEVLDHGGVARQDLGIDARWAILPTLIASGSGVFSLVEQRFADGDLSLFWQAIPTLQLFAKGRHVSPDLYLGRNSIFSVFSYTGRETVGGGASWEPIARLSFYGEYQALWVDGGFGNDAELRVAYRFLRSSTVGINSHLLFVPENGYTDVRCFVAHSLTKQFRVSADLDWTSFAKAINAQRYALIGTASVSYAIGKGWNAMLSGSVGTSPQYEVRYDVTARITYDFNYDANRTVKGSP